jgi:hypothetical protein
MYVCVYIYIYICVRVCIYIYIYIYIYARARVSAGLVVLTCSVALVCKRTIPTEQPSLVGEVCANVCGLWGVA